MVSVLISTYVEGLCGAKRRIFRSKCPRWTGRPGREALSDGVPSMSPCGGRTGVASDEQKGVSPREGFVVT